MCIHVLERFSGRGKHAPICLQPETKTDIKMRADPGFGICLTWSGEGAVEGNSCSIDPFSP